MLVRASPDYVGRDDRRRAEWIAERPEIVDRECLKSALGRQGKEGPMSTVTTKDGVTIFYKDWGPKTAQPIVFHHGWPLSADDWDAQMLYFIGKGYRVVAHDRRGHGLVEPGERRTRHGPLRPGRGRGRRASEFARRHPHRPFDGRRRGNPLCGAPRQGPYRQIDLDRRRAAAHVEDGCQSGWYAHRGLRRPPAGDRRQPSAVLHGIRERSLLQLQPAGREAVAERDRQLVASGHDGRRESPVRWRKPSRKPTSPRT